jgi:predicted RNA methylase
MPQQVPQSVLAVLSDCTTDGALLFLPRQLPRPDYLAVDKVLKLAGGKWDRRAGAHIFGGDAAELIDAIILTGTIVDRKQEFGEFFTSRDLAQIVVMAGKVRPGMRVLEPSAGQGAIALAAKDAGAEVLAIEIQERNCAVLREKGFQFACATSDFLTINPKAPGMQFDAVLMNPPFAKRADVAHVLHALQFVKPGGILVAIMSAGIQFRREATTRALRQIIDDQDGEIRALPPDSFKTAGTGVNTCLVTIPC